MLIRPTVLPVLVQHELITVEQTWHRQEAGDDVSARDDDDEARFEDVADLYKKGHADQAYLPVVDEVGRILTRGVARLQETACRAVVRVSRVAAELRERQREEKRQGRFQGLHTFVDG